MASTDSSGGTRSTEDRLGDPGNLAKSGTSPQQPDYIGAANAQSRGSIGTALANNLMSHPDSYTPLGSQTWNQTGSTKLNIPGLGEIDIPQFSNTVNLSPEQQRLYEGQTGIAEDLTGQAATSLGAPRDLNSVQDISDKAYSAMTSRLDPQWAQNQQQQETQLRNQGLVPGGEAYDNAMRVFGQSKNDAYQQANLGAIQTMPQTYQLDAAQRSQPLNELNALRTGSPVNMPQFQPIQYPGQAQGPNTLGATQMQGQWEQQMYNQIMGQNNAKAQGLASLGSAWLSA